MSMNLKVQHLMDSTLVISEIIRDNAPMPQKGKYRLARMHPKMVKEFEIINQQRNDMIKAYGTKAMVPNPENRYSEEARREMIAAGRAGDLVPVMIESPTDYTVPEDKLEEFNAAWKEIADTEIELDIE